LQVVGGEVGRAVGLDVELGPVVLGEEPGLVALGLVPVVPKVLERVSAGPHLLALSQVLRGFRVFPPTEDHPRTITDRTVGA
jgi:hypothetical protein